MTEFVRVTLENEMDLTLAYKKSIKVAEMLGLTVSAQTTFATAVSEVSREVIDKTFDGVARLGTAFEDGRFLLTAIISFKQEEESLKDLQAGFQYAQKLVPVFEVTDNNDNKVVTLQLGIPRSQGVNRTKVAAVRKYFETEGPTSAYEEVKLRNMQLFRLTEEQENQLKESQYLNELKNEFFSVASHELKNPLTIIKAYSQLAMSLQAECSPVMLNCLQKIETQSSKLHMLIQQLFDVSKIEQGKLEYLMEEVNFDQYLHETLDLIRFVTPQHKLEITISPQQMLVSVDKIRIEQVLTNIIGNAAKYSVPGSTIQLETAVEDDRIVTAVKDYGIGMDEETLQNVFEKFYRSREVIKKYSGLGMGLYIASRIINDHGGRIWAESKTGKGSVFYFDLPVRLVAN